MKSSYIKTGKISWTSVDIGKVIVYDTRLEGKDFETFPFTVVLHICI